MVDTLHQMFEGLSAIRWVVLFVIVVATLGILMDALYRGKK